MRRIVICPSFASSHHIECHIPNMIEALNPDVIIYNEGLFPQGPENKGHVDSGSFKKKFCFRDTNAGFDFRRTLAIANDNSTKTIINVGNIAYKSTDANECFIEAISSFGIDRDTFNPIVPDAGDIIFPLEPDAFLLEADAGKISSEISKLSPGEGLSCRWVDFIETQYYTEAINMQQPKYKYRRFCYCFDNMENYKAAMSGFMSQNYPTLKKTDEFFVRHYPWFVYDKWKELRYELIYRSDPQYWRDFDTGLDRIRQLSEYLDKRQTKEYHPNVIIRPSRLDVGRYATFIDIEHPEAIKNHPNFVK